MARLDYIEKENPPKAKAAALIEIGEEMYQRIGMAKVFRENVPGMRNLESRTDYRAGYHLEQGITLVISQAMDMPKPMGTAPNIEFQENKWHPRGFSFYGQRSLIEEVVEDIIEYGTKLDLISR